MAPKIYYFHGSSGCRAVFATAKMIVLALDLHKVDYEKGELNSPAYLKLNPQHKVPTLTDGEIVVCDSHAINSYLVGKYAKDDSLYPKDVVKKAAVDEKLYFDASSFAAALYGLLEPIMYKESKTIPEKKIKQVQELYGVLEKFLEVGQWVTGDTLTIADFSLYTTITCFAPLIPIDSKKFPNVTSWMERSKALPCFENDQKEIEFYLMWYNSLLV